MENQAIEPSVERSADLSGFDEKLSTILKDFFQEKQIPIDGQQLLAHELRRSFVYSAAGFDAYLSGDPAKGSLRGIFGSTSISTRKGMQVWTEVPRTNWWSTSSMFRQRDRFPLQKMQ